MMHRQDYDVQLPRLEDFTRPDNGAQSFISLTHICVELANISYLMNLHRDIIYDEILPILTSLQKWIDELPEALRICAPNGERKRYSRLVLELHIPYFMAIILLYLLPGYHRRSQYLCTASIVASSCAARLYEDILCHEDVTYLVPIHGWMVLVIAVPQVYCAAKCAGQETVCSEELDLVCSVLTQMCEKYTSARMVLGKITRFRRDGNHIPGLAGASGNENDAANLHQYHHDPDENFSNIGSLFPFPSNICPKMGLLQRPPVVDNVNNNMFSPFNMGDFNWTFDWTTPMEDLDAYDGLYQSTGML